MPSKFRDNKQKTHIGCAGLYAKGATLFHYRCYRKFHVHSAPSLYKCTALAVKNPYS